MQRYLQAAPRQMMRYQKHQIVKHRQQMAAARLRLETAVILPQFHPARKSARAQRSTWILRLSRPIPGSHIVNGNIPYFTASDLTSESFEYYSDLDNLGRCGTAYASVGTDLMPTEKRGSISKVKPSGWQISKYDFVDGKYLYNRCHLIGYQLTAENANEKNLITGTRYLNVDGMLPFENLVADYVKETDNHVLYRVTPVFEGDNLVASGVLMEAESVEDEGDGVEYCVYVYNVQPGVMINYATGENAAVNR